MAPTLYLDYIGLSLLGTKFHWAQKRIPRGGGLGYTIKITQKCISGGGGHVLAQGSRYIGYNFECHPLRILGPSNGRVWTCISGVRVLKIATFWGVRSLRAIYFVRTFFSVKFWGMCSTTMDICLYRLEKWLTFFTAPAVPTCLQTYPVDTVVCFFWWLFYGFYHSKFPLNYSTTIWRIVVIFPNHLSNLRIELKVLKSFCCWGHVFQSTMCFLFLLALDRFFVCGPIWTDRTILQR